MSEILILSIFGAGFGGFLFLSGIRWMGKKRLVENIPTSKIRSVAMGLVEIFGEAVPAEGQTLKSPFSGRECVYYRYTVEEYRSNGKHSYWSTVKKGDSGKMFYLRDSTGHVMVDPKGADVDIPKDYEFNSSGFGGGPPETIVRFLDGNNIRHKGFLGFNRKMRFREYYIAPGDKVYVMGTAADNPFVEDGTRSEGVEDVIIRKGKHDKFFYISDKPEKDIVKNLRWKVIGGIFGGGFIIVASLFLLLLQIGVFPF